MNAIDAIDDRIEVLAYGEPNLDLFIEDGTDLDSEFWAYNVDTQEDVLIDGELYEFQEIN